MSIEAHTEAWRTATEAILGGHRAVMTWAEAQNARESDALPTRYVLLGVEFRSGAPRHAVGRTPMRGYRVRWLCVGSEYERMWARDRIDGLCDVRLAAIDSTPLTHDVDNETDDGDLLTQWIYAAPA